MPTPRKRPTALYEALARAVDELGAAEAKLRADRDKKEEKTMVQISPDTAKRIARFIKAGGNGMDPETEHTYNGSCPTRIDSRTRDVDCPACQLLIKVEEALEGDEGDQDTFDKILEGKW